MQQNVLSLETILLVDRGWLFTPLRPTEATSNLGYWQHPDMTGQHEMYLTHVVQHLVTVQLVS
jgi:hypothetical protein